MSIDFPFSEFILYACKNLFWILMFCFIFNEESELALKYQI